MLSELSPFIWYQPCPASGHGKPVLKQKKHSVLRIYNILSNKNLKTVDVLSVKLLFKFCTRSCPDLVQFKSSAAQYNFKITQIIYNYTFA